MLEVRDKVKIKDDGPEIWTIAKSREAPKLFWIELNGDAATGTWKKESELELVEKAKMPDTGDGGFYPEDPIM
jgi:hypothetical protein